MLTEKKQGTEKVAKKSRKNIQNGAKVVGPEKGKGK